MLILLLVYVRVVGFAYGSFLALLVGAILGNYGYHGYRLVFVRVEPKRT